MSITELAQQAGTSESTIVRLSRSLDFDGFHDLKISLAQEIIPVTQQVYREIYPGDDEATIIRKVCQANARVCADTEQVLDPAQLRRAVEVLEGCRYVTVLGLGGSGAVALDLHNKLLRLGLFSRVVHDSHFQSMSAVATTDDHVVIGISASGRSRDIVETMRMARGSGATTVAITNHLGAPICQHSDIVLLAAPPRDWSAGVATDSRLSQLCLVDALYAALALRNDGALARNLVRTKKSLESKRLS